LTPSTKGIYRGFAALTVKRIRGENEIECHQMLRATIFAFELDGAAGYCLHHGVSFL
jgi:hypothetical protein